MKTVRRIEQNQSVQCSRLRVAAYCRVSTDYDAQLESLETQKSHYENYIRLQDNWELAGIYFDEGISGTKSDSRPELQRMMADCRAGKIDYILTKSISRFSRNTTDCIDLVRSLLRLNIPIYFEKENLNTGSMEGELILSILSSMAEDESRSISNNSKWSLERRFLNGTFKSSSLPYGYKREGEDIVIIPDEAEIIKRIFAENLRGNGVHRIAAGLNRDGILTRSNGFWNPSTILAILKNETYQGDVLFQKTFVDENYRHRANRKRWYAQYLITDHHEPIISREVFTATGKSLERRAAGNAIEKDSQKYLNRYVFTGKIICGECGATFKRRINSGSGSGYVAWCCSRHLWNSSECSMKFIRESGLMLAFCTMMNKLVFAGERILLPYLEGLKGSTDNADLKRISALKLEMEKIVQQKLAVTRLMAQGALTPVLYGEKMNSLESEADLIRREVTTLKRHSDGVCSMISEVKKLIAFTRKGEMLTEFREELFGRFVTKIRVISRGLVSFELKCGLSLKEELS